MGRMKQLWALTAVAVLAIIAAGWFLGAKPQAAKVGTLNQSTEEQLSANSDLSKEIKRLSDMRSGVGKQQKRLRAIAANIPDNPALPSLIRSLSKIEEATGVRIDSITPAPPAFEAVPAAAPVTKSSAATSSGDEADDSAGKKGTSKSKTGAATKSTATIPAAPTAGQLASIPLTLNVSGDFADVQLFMSRLETLQRTIVVGSLSITRDAQDTEAISAAASGGGSLKVTVTGRIFMRVPPSAVAPTSPAVAPAEK
jgi:Tfp pilus assembly protein PilO